MKNNAFTLVEMSIVLVIIGLIVGGVLVGRDLVQSARISRQVSQIQAFNAATRAFQGKYGYIPGDIPGTKALAYGLDTVNWGGGDGDGVLRDGNNHLPIQQLWQEPLYFFLYLSNARMTKVTYRSIGSHYSFEEGEQLPCAELAHAGIIAYSMADQKLAWYLGLNVSMTNGTSILAAMSTAGVLAAADAFALDMKMDDGLPLGGGTRASAVDNNLTLTWHTIIDDTTATSCITSVAANSYNVVDPAPNCRLSIVAR